MSRFDDDLRHAAAQLAREPISPDALDPALDEPPPRSRRPLVGAAAAGLLIAAVGLGLVLGRPAPDTADPSQVAQPSEAPSPSASAQPLPIRHQVEVDGIRLTVELEGHRFSEGVPIIATATVENVGPDPVFYPVSSTCEWATDIGMERVPEFGRGQTWDGISARLKRSLLGPWGYEEFTPYSFVDSSRLPELRTGCFMDAGRIEIAPGTTRTDRLAWRPSGPLGMPFPSGTYRVTVTFARIGADEADEMHDRDPSDNVSLAFDIEIAGGTEETVMPWDAVDIMLADARFQNLLARDPPERWLPVTLEYADDRWMARVPVRKPNSRAIAYVITAEVDARSGELISVAPGGDDLAQPTTPPAVAARHEHEADGLRLVVELDRSATVAGEPIRLVTSVGNVGAESVFWGHSSTCPWPVSVTLEPETWPAFDPGATWEGDAAILKSVSVDDRWLQQPTFYTVPSGWLASDANHACTSDLVTSELAPGATARQELAWEALGPHRLPPPPGTYTATAIFAYMSRGEPPGFDDNPDEFAITMTFTVEVVGSPLDILSPGLAFDAVLADARVQQLLAEHPREDWVSSELTLEGDRWVAAVYLEPSPPDASDVAAIVTEVDARTGAVLSVRFEEEVGPP
jgi:hypothetical protein